jgi:hypothetical protein
MTVAVTVWMRKSKLWRTRFVYCVHINITLNTPLQSAAHTRLCYTLPMATSGYTVRNTDTQASSVHVYNFVCKFIYTNEIALFVAWSRPFLHSVIQNWPNPHLHRFYGVKTILNNVRLSSSLHLRIYILRPFYDIALRM